MNFSRKVTAALTLVLLTSAVLRAQDENQAQKRQEALRADSLFKAGFSAFKLRKLDEALNAWLAANDIFIKLGEKKARLVVLGNLATAYRFKQDAVRYRESLEQQIVLSREVRDLKSLARAHMSLGLVEAQADKLPTALTHLDSARIYFEAGSDLDGLADAHSNLGQLYHRTANYLKALHSYRLAMDMHRKANDLKGVSIDLTGLGAIYTQLSRYDSALVFLEKSLALKIRFSDHEGQAVVLNHIGNVFDYRGNYEKAREYYLKAHDINVQIKNPRGVADNLMNLGVVLHNSGSYQKALESYQKALAIHSQLNSTRETARDLTNIGLIYRDLNELETALEYLDKAVAIEMKIGDNKGLASDYHIIGSIHWKQNDNQKALEYLEKSLALRRQIGDLKGEADDLMNIGFIQLTNLELIAERNDPVFQQLQRKVLRYFVTADSIKAGINDINGRMTAQTYLGQTYRLMQDYGRARQHFSTAIELAQTLKASTIEWQARYGLAKTLKKEGNAKQAIQEMRSAVRILENQRVGLKSEEFRIGFFKNKSFVYADLIELYVNEGRFDEALNFVERSRSRSFLDILGTKYLQSTKADNPLILELDQIDQKLAKIQVLLDENRSDLATKPLVNRLDSLGKQRQSLLAAIKASNDELSSLISVSPLKSRDISDLITKDMQVIEYYVTPSYFLIFVISGSEIHCVKTVNQSARLLSLVFDFRNDLMITYRDRFQRSGTKLYELLVAPVEQYLTGKQLIIIPHERLHYIPFGALANADGKFLIERYTLNYLPSASLLKFVIQKRKSTKSIENSAILALGNPDVPKMSPLPAAEIEVNAIAKLFSNKLILTGKQATEVRIKQESEKYNLLHFACHGKFNLTHPTKSALYLSSSPHDDGKLYVDEIFALKFPAASLVVLSACETGLSKIIQGDELIGLSRAFIYAGTPSLISTLWSVNDESTGKLMQSFYQNLTTQGKAHALQSAQLQLKAIEQYSHPYFWSGFTLVGDWQ